MKTRTGFSALTLLMACSLGIVIGTAMNERRPQVALAKPVAATQAAIRR